MGVSADPGRARTRGTGPIGFARRANVNVGFGCFSMSRFAPDGSGRIGWGEGGSRPSPVAVLGARDASPSPVCWNR